jgi:hypothetical protein
MTSADLEKIHRALAGMEAVLAQSPGGRADDEPLLAFRHMCWTALLLVDDGECQEQIDLLVQSAKELYSDCEQARVESLRGKISLALDAFRARLHGLEAGYGKRWRDLRAA